MGSVHTTSILSLILTCLLSSAIWDISHPCSPGTLSPVLSQQWMVPKWTYGVAMDSLALEWMVLEAETPKANRHRHPSCSSTRSVSLAIHLEPPPPRIHSPQVHRAVLCSPASGVSILLPTAPPHVSCFPGSRTAWFISQSTSTQAVRRRWSLRRLCSFDSWHKQGKLQYLLNRGG